MVIYCEGGDITINGNISSSTNIGICCEGGDITINGNVISNKNAPNGFGVAFFGRDSVTFIMQNGKIVCTHAGTKAIYADEFTNVKLMNVWSNRELEETVTNLITGGFVYDADVQ